MTKTSVAPDFFLVGAPKSATSSLHKILIKHPDIFMCRPKEPHFYSSDLAMSEVEDQAGYDALFAAAPDGARLGEASAFYLSSETAAQNIHNANPDARIILSIRNPADAAFSLYHQLRDGFREDQPSFEKAWALQEARAQGRQLPSYCPEPKQLQYREVYSYHDQISRYFDVFGQDQVKVLRFDTIIAEPTKVVEEVLDFIGVDSFEEPAELPKTNTRRQAKFPALTQFLTAPPAVLRPFVGPVKASLNRLGIKPSVIMMKHLSRPAEKQVTKMDAAFRQTVVESFSDDVDRLERLLGWDLSTWRN